jgi:CHAT domain-containing protein
MLPQLRNGRAKHPLTPAALVVGNVDFGNPFGEIGLRAGHFVSLPATEDEARAAANLFRTAFPRGQVITLFGKDATKMAFVKRSTEVSHLIVATHGFFVRDPSPKKQQPLLASRTLPASFLSAEVIGQSPQVRSGLVIAGANRSLKEEGDAILTALEVSEMDLRKADLVVLSTCEMGLGQLQESDGMLGLQGAFQVACARATFSSLWNVRGKATQDLMSRYYRNLWDKEGAAALGKLAALREAQLWLLREGATHPELLRGGLQRPHLKPGERDPVSPYYWAAFVLSGDWR